MKKNLSQKRSKIPAKKSLPKIASAPAIATPAEVISLPPRTPISMPPPDFLFREAEQEPDLRRCPHMWTHSTLRDKGSAIVKLRIGFQNAASVPATMRFIEFTQTACLTTLLEDVEAQEAEEEARRIYESMRSPFITAYQQA
jgi:hypothetical protein